MLSCSVMSNSLDPMDCSLPGSSVHRDSPGKNTRGSYHALLQGIFPTQGLNSGLPHCRWILYHLNHQGSPRIREWVASLLSRGSSQPKNRSCNQFSSVAQSCPTLCDPMNRSTPGLPVHHQLPEFTQTHVHQVSDAIQLSHPRSSPSPPAPYPSQHQSLFQ